jgi:hypothetical protein
MPGYGHFLLGDTAGFGWLASLNTGGSGRTSAYWKAVMAVYFYEIII